VAAAFVQQTFFHDADGCHRWRQASLIMLAAGLEVSEHGHAVPMRVKSSIESFTFAAMGMASSEAALV